MDDSSSSSIKKSKSTDWQMDLRRPEAASFWLSAIVESADDAVISKTLDGIITSWNAGAQRIFGYTPEEAIGQPITMLIPADHSNEEPVILARIKAGERVEHYETVRARKDGTLVDISLTVSPIRNANNQIIGASKIARDITERKRTEQILREQSEIIEVVNTLGQTLAAELDSQKLVQAVTDAATGITTAQFGAFFYNLPNEQGESYMRYALAGVPREMFAHFPMLRNTDIFSPTFKGQGTICIDDVTKDPRYGRDSPYYGMPEGHCRVTSYLAVPVISRSGDVYGGLFFGHQKNGVFSERAARIVEGIAAQAAIAMDNASLYEAAQKAQRQAEYAARQAEESSRLKEEFLATISHELRTPLNAILGWSRMLRSGKMESNEAAKALQTIERNARAQSQLIDDLLDVSRIITGKLRIDVRPIDPTIFTEAAIEAVQPAAEAKGVRIVKVIDTGASSVPGDPVRLQQVIWNLVSNAVKFTPRGGRIQVQLERVNSHIEIAVSDTGQGIPAEFIPHVFDRFRQADQASTRQHGGMGLGLAIVRNLVEMHGGSVEAKSLGKDQGATFTVRLPVSPIYQVDQTEGRIYPGARDLELPADMVDRLDGIKILVVDDEQDTRDLLKAGLTECGATVIAASSADEAFEVLQKDMPDLLVSDIGMPTQDGYEFIRRVREHSNEQNRRMPAIALTAYARFEDRLKALRAGYQMHVPKPVELAELVAVIASIVERRQY
jgi:PAS domain S-box-containing protein